MFFRERGEGEDEDEDGEEEDEEEYDEEEAAGGCALRNLWEETSPGAKEVLVEIEMAEKHRRECALWLANSDHQKVKSESYDDDEEYDAFGASCAAWSCLSVLCSHK